MWQDLILVFDLADIEAVEVSPEDGSDQFGLFFHDGDLAVLHLIAKGQVAPDPQALALGGRDLVPDPLRGDLSFELGKDSSTLSVNRPMEVVVLNCWVTETNENRQGRHSAGAGTASRLRRVDCSNRIAR